ncbi:MAG TPA: hypothetical protein ACFE0H_01935 [Elainellaceae cyanobacterium]
MTTCGERHSCAIASLLIFAMVCDRTSRLAVRAILSALAVWSYINYATTGRFAVSHEGI